mgnify:CR=1 FL=1
MGLLDMLVLEPDYRDPKLFEKQLHERRKVLACGTRPLTITEVVTIRTQINWIVNFGTVFDEFVRVIARFPLKAILGKVKRLELDDIVDCEQAVELDISKEDLSKGLEKLQRIAGELTSQDQAIYELMGSSQKSKRLFLAFLISSIGQSTGKKIFLCLNGMNLACLAISHYVFAGVIINLLTMLHILRASCCIYLPCENEKIKVLRDMRDYVVRQKKAYAVESSSSL